MNNKVANCLFISNRPPLQRGSSFTFLTPGTPWDFSLVSHNDKINIIILCYHVYLYLSSFFQNDSIKTHLISSKYITASHFSAYNVAVNAWCESHLFALFSFQKRKRKEKEDDTVSLSSFDLKVSVMKAP